MPRPVLWFRALLLIWDYFIIRYSLLLIDIISSLNLEKPNVFWMIISEIYFDFIRKRKRYRKHCNYNWTKMRYCFLVIWMTSLVLLRAHHCFFCLIYCVYFSYIFPNNFFVMVGPDRGNSKRWYVLRIGLMVDYGDIIKHWVNKFFDYLHNILFSYFLKICIMRC